MNEYKKWANLNIDEVDLMEVSQLEKQRVKQKVIKSKQKRSKKVLFRNIAIASAIAFGATVTTGLIPSFAAQIPFIQNVLSYFQNEGNFYEKYDEFATTVGEVQSSNGVTIMIDNAVYDGTSITISYAIETTENLGEQPTALNNLNLTDTAGLTGMTGSSTVKKIGDTTYVGVYKLTPHFIGNKERDKVFIKWEPEKITDYESGLTVKGDWAFNFSLSKVNVVKQLVNVTRESRGVTLKFNEINRTDVSTVLHYEQLIDEKIYNQWADVGVKFEIVDNLGTSYHVKNNGASSNDGGVTFHGSDTMGAINNKAIKLIVTPTFIFSLGEGKGHENVQLDPIEVDLK